MISRKATRDFGKEHADSVPSLSNWLAITRKAIWRNFTELRKDFGSADQVGRRTVFNIGGNKYRLVAYVQFPRQIVYVKAVLTHTQYDKGDWKK